MDDLAVTDVPQHNRYEACLDGELVGFVDYHRDDVRGAVLLTHAEVHRAREGRGIGSKMVRAALDDLAARSERVEPVCSFVRAFVRDNPEYQPLVGPRPPTGYSNGS